MDDAGIVDQHVDRRPSPATVACDEVLDLRLVADIAAHEAHGAERADLLDRAAAGILVDVRDDDARAIGDEAPRDREADPLRPAGDDRDLVLQRHGGLPIGADHAATQPGGQRRQVAALRQSGVPRAIRRGARMVRSPSRE